MQSQGDLERARLDPTFSPLYAIATDFTWHSNYGYRAEIAKPECYIDLGELFLAYEFSGLDYRDPATDHSPLSAAVSRGNHPGIIVYIRWLLENGAGLRVSDTVKVNPMKIAHAKGFTEIAQLLKAYAGG